MADAQRVFGFVMGLYNQILTELNNGRAVVPPHADDPDALGLWCSGYLKAARLDDAWLIDDEHGVALLFPIAVLAGEIELTGEQDSDGKVIEDPTPQLERCRVMLGRTTVDIHKYWTAWRREHSAAPVVQRGPKIGRNDKCPCGSGQKYKKCCALKAS